MAAGGAARARGRAVPALPVRLTRGRGSERGSERAWFYETYDLDLSAEAHTLTALVWQLGEIGPLAQIGMKGEFLREAEGPSGKARSTRPTAWEAKQN